MTPPQPLLIFPTSVGTRSWLHRSSLLRLTILYYIARVYLDPIRSTALELALTNILLVGITPSLGLKLSNDLAIICLKLPTIDSTIINVTAFIVILITSIYATRPTAPRPPWEKRHCAVIKGTNTTVPLAPPN